MLAGSLLPRCDSYSLDIGRRRWHFYAVSGRTVDMAEAYRAALVPERHRDAVEKYVRDLEELDETQDGDRADLRN